MLNPGVTSQTITVKVNGDTTTEPDETFFVTLSAPVNASISKAQGQVTIVNDDPQPILAAADVSVGAEGNVGITAASLELTLSNPSAQEISIDWATSMAPRKHRSITLATAGP